MHVCVQILQLRSISVVKLQTSEINFFRNVEKYLFLLIPLTYSFDIVSSRLERFKVVFFIVKTC